MKKQIKKLALNKANVSSLLEKTAVKGGAFSRKCSNRVGCGGSNGCGETLFCE